MHNAVHTPGKRSSRLSTQISRPTRRTLKPTADPERGAILIYMAVILLVLTAFTTFVVDYGVLWVARGQAQNAADAAAFAGAIGLAYDDPNDLTDTSPAKQSAFAASQSNFVWGEAPDVQITTDITFPVCPDGTDNPCVRAGVYRNQARGNALPMFFGQILGLTDQGIRATATAQVMAANASECLKPGGGPTNGWRGTRSVACGPPTTVSTYTKVNREKGPRSRIPISTCHRTSTVRAQGSRSRWITGRSWSSSRASLKMRRHLGGSIRCS